MPCPSSRLLRSDLRGLLVSVALISGLALITGTASASTRFHGDVAGVASGPGHSFYVGDGLYLRFRDNQRAGTRYKVCFTRGQGRRCLRRTTGSKARISRIFTAAPQNVGTYTATWYVAGKAVASWSWHNGAGD